MGNFFNKLWNSNGFSAFRQTGNAPRVITGRTDRRGFAKAREALCAAVVAAACLPGQAAAARCADVALVLAIDASGSISSSEFDLQIEGYYSALTNPAVSASFAQAGVVDIAAVLWADSAYKPQIIPWHRVTTPRHAQEFAATLSSTERLVSGNTDIGVGLHAAIRLLEEPGQCAERMVIDVSGDGRASVVARRSNTESLFAARARAEYLGITVNALAITVDEADLADYYRRAVTTGVESFVMEVGGFDTFRQAIAEKLMREVLSGTPADPACSEERSLAPPATCGTM
jgi:hypothetical protein